MSARASGSGTISFGLVSIPVKMYSTGQSSSGISFNLLHKDCHSRLKQYYTCPKDNVTVDRSDMVKGYEFSKDQYVVFSEEELKAIEEQASEAIEIAEFVPLSQVDPVYFEKAYYLGPDKGAERSYRLLKEAMIQTGRAALARYSARGKQYLVLLRPKEEGLVMQQLKYADEVRSFADVPIPAGEVREPELKLATQLIEQSATESFEPEKYEDAVKKRLLSIIEQKIQGQPITAEPVAAPQGQIIDLMEALKASLAQAAAETSSVSDAERKPPKRATTQDESEARPAKRRKESK
jgi:DNA end-binding protein Ku